MDATLRERFARLEPGGAIDRVCSGWPAMFVLRPARGRPFPRIIGGMHALVGRGLRMLRAKRAIEALVETGWIVVDLPTVEDPAALSADLARAGIAAARVEAETEFDAEGAYAPTDRPLTLRGS